MNEKKKYQQVTQLYEEHGKDLPLFEMEMQKLIKQGTENSDFYLIGIANHFLSIANYIGGGERDKVLFHAIKATAMLEKIGERDTIAIAYNMLGIAYLAQENYQLALESYNKAFWIFRLYRKRDLIKYRILNNIADCYFEMGDYESSLKIFSDLLKREKNRKNPNHLSLAIFSINLSSCQEQMKNYEAALKLLDTLTDWIDELDDTIWPCIYYARRFCVLYSMGDIAGGNQCADKLLSLLSTRNDMYEYHSDFEEIAHLLIKQGDFKRAKIFADILASYAEKSGHTIDQLMTCRLKADYYNKMGDTANALAYYDQLNQLYEKRNQESKEMQLTVLKKIKEADVEIAKLNKRIEQSEKSASRDSLTGLLNRAALLEVVSKFIDTAKVKKEKVGAIFIDVDFFKEYNDTYGHLNGDVVIKEVAGICLREETKNIQFARFGGDEFFGITHGLQDDDLAEIARRICTKIQKTSLIHEKNPNGHRVTLSIGLVNSYVTEHFDTVIDIANLADKALYQAKGAGKNAVFLCHAQPSQKGGEEISYEKIET